MGYLSLITPFEELRHMLDGRKGNAKGRGLRDEIHRRIKQRRQSHAIGTQDHGNQLIAHKTDNDIQSLYAAEDARIF
jgi:hypothetical protein